MSTESKFDLWCIVELFGHAKIAGRCTEQNIAGSNMLRVDVPETERQPAFTRYFGGSAIYAINPVDEATARMYAKNLEAAPVNSWAAETFMQKYQINKQRQLAGLPDIEDPDDRIDF
jgi:hypothetical protein